MVYDFVIKKRLYVILPPPAEKRLHFEGVSI